MSELFDYLGARYDEARRGLDEVRVRAFELVVAACVNESGDPRAGDILGGASRESFLTEEETSATPAPAPAKREEPPPPPELPDDLDEEPPGPEPEEPSAGSAQERAPVVDREPTPRNEEHTAPLWPPVAVDGAPEEPVRGSWVPPER